MTGLNGIVSDLERQKRAIDKALEALLAVDGDGATSASAPSVNRRSEGQKARWAQKKAAGIKVPIKTAPHKGGMTEDGRRRLAEAMRKRWAVKRAASAVKKGRRKAA